MRQVLAVLAILAAAVPCAAEKDPIEAVRDAIQATRESGGWECAGDVKGGQGGMTVMIGALGGGGRPAEGALTCRMDADGDVELRLESGEERVGVTRVGDAVRKSAEWSGEALDVDAFATSALRLTSWKELRAAVKKAKNARLETEGDTDVVTMSLPKNFLRKSPESAKVAGVHAQAIVEGEFMETKSLKARFEIDRKSGRLASMRFEIARGAGELLIGQVDEQLGPKDGYGEWGDEEGEDEEHPGHGAAREALKSAETKVTWEFREFRYDERITVESPK